jgi:hypothetical protein
MNAHYEEEPTAEVAAVEAPAVEAEATKK